MVMFILQDGEGLYQKYATQVAMNSKMEFKKRFPTAKIDLRNLNKIYYVVTFAV